MRIPRNEKLFSEISNLSTEQRNHNSIDIDSKSILEILQIINKEDKSVPLAVEKEISSIEQAVELIVDTFNKSGRLLYFGAGTSGRLGILDASECPPTFGTNPEMIQAFIAGGKNAVFKAKEGAEDSEANGKKDVLKAKITECDIVCGIAASSRTPYVIGALKKAKELGARTIYITCAKREELSKFDYIDVIISPYVGPEVIMGSTRMKSGTAQKLILNMLTTASMIRLGKVYENMMIDLQMTNKKLVERAKRTIMIVTGVSYKQSSEYIISAQGNVKIALVMILADVDFEEAKHRLKMGNGSVREAIKK